MEPRPSVLPSVTLTVPFPNTTGGQCQLDVIVSFLHGRPVEVFLEHPPLEIADLCDGLAKTVSGWLRSGGTAEDVIRMLRGINGGHAVWWEGRVIHSIPDGVAQVLEYILENWEAKFARMVLAAEEMMASASVPAIPA